MPLLNAEAAHLSNNQLVAGIIQEIVDVDNVFQFLPFTKINGKAYVYNRENVLALSQFITTNVDVPESASSFTEINVTLRIVAGDVDVDNFLAETQSDTNNQKAIQIALKAKSVSRLFSNKFVNGAASTAYNLTSLGGAAAATNVEFDGLDVLCTAGNTITAGVNGAAFAFGFLDQLLDKVKMGADVLVMNRYTIRAFQAALRALSQVNPDYIQLDNGKRIMSYSGVPILLNDYISQTQTVGSSSLCSTIYAMRMNEVDGLHGVYGGESAGIRLVEIGQLQHRDATRTRIKWYCALALKATLSLARVVGVL